LQASGPLRPNVTSSITPEAHNVAQRHRRRTESRPQGICTKFRADRSSGSRDCSWTDRHSHRRVDHNTPHPYRGRVIITLLEFTFKHRLQLTAAYNAYWPATCEVQLTRQSSRINCCNYEDDCGNNVTRRGHLGFNN